MYLSLQNLGNLCPSGQTQTRDWVPAPKPTALFSEFTQIGFVCLFVCLLRGREREREGEKHQCERNIDWLPLVHTPTGD